VKIVAIGASFLRPSIRRLLSPAVNPRRGAARSLPNTASRPALVSADAADGRPAARGLRRRLRTSDLSTRSRAIAEERTMSVEELRRSPMMDHLLAALERGEDIGHYGRLTFAMIGRYFVDPDELVTWLAKDRECDEGEAKALAQQVAAHDYSPPSRRRILEWQARQSFPICPTPDDPDTCNAYQELDLPPHVYAEIEEYREQQYDAQAGEPG
jgi:hypothetical protein